MVGMREGMRGEYVVVSVSVQMDTLGLAIRWLLLFRKLRKLLLGRPNLENLPVSLLVVQSNPVTRLTRLWSLSVAVSRVR
jgi:hypothetical protein